MAIFEEKQTGAFAALLILTLLFLLTFPFWHVNDQELLWQEGEYAVAVMELQDLASPVTVHGHRITDTPHLFLLLARSAVQLGIPLTAALRLLPLLSWLILTWLVFFICKRNCGIQAACSAAAIMFTTAIVVERLSAGYPMALTALLLYSGWLVWIDQTLSRSRWGSAWIFAGIFGFLIYCNAGLTGLLYFIVPLAMQRRPLTIWQKLNHSGFYVFLLLTAGGILLYSLRHAALPPPPPADLTFSEYLRNILIFPVNTFLRLLPWSLLLWAPFCAALVPLTPNPLFGKFHRITLITLLLMIWFNPFSTARDLFYLMPVMAVLVGTYYWILVRRYGYRITRLARLCTCLLIAVTVCYLTGIFAFPEFTERMMSSFLTLPGDMIRSALVCGTVILLGFLTLLLLRIRGPVWLSVAVISAGTALFSATVQQPEKLKERSKHEFAEKLKHAVNSANGKDAVVYTNLYGLYTEGYYAGLKLRFSDIDRLPENEETVYFISTEAPFDPDRLWSKLLDTNYKYNRLFLYKGLAIRSEDEDDI